MLPAFGIFSEVVSTFSGKRLFGYTSMVYATVVITILSYLVWLHHFFTMGSGASVNSFFGITTMIISIPTGAKIFNWLFTMYRGRIRFEVPMLWTIGFMVTFVIGGMTGVLLAVPPADFVLHNSLFLIAHFHNVIIGGVVFGVFAGINYWFPKAFGFKLDVVLGQGLLLVLAGRLLPRLHAAVRAGPDGRDPPHEPLRRSVAADLVRHRRHRRGADRLGIALLPDAARRELPRREQLRDVTGDPWNGRTLEWSTSSPPPDYNFAFTPVVHDTDAWYDMKKRGYQRPTTASAHPHAEEHRRRLHHRDAATVLGFALIWHMWLAPAGFAALIVAAIVHTFNYNRDFHIPAEEVASQARKRAHPRCWPPA
jgi:cytochrome o ubiquinol oxidase subunit 1